MQAAAQPMETAPDALTVLSEPDAKKAKAM